MERRAKINWALAVLVVLALIIFFSFFDPTTFPFFPRCFFYALTGFECPGCGTSRALHSLAHGHLIEAFSYNPILFLAIPTVIILIFSKRARRSVALPVIVLIVILLYWVIRNLPQFQSLLQSLR
ncbi:DUF2752 domain-containing protein [bacterium]|nr:DUF2752 domain-containing protein [bacterium]